MRRYTYVYMLFLACSLFDTSSGTSSTPTTTTAQASSKELVREAFAEFDRACEEYYATSPYAQESIYVDELLEIKENKHIEDDCSLKKKN